MPILDFPDFAAAIGEGAVIAGLDVGSKTIGIAVSDRDWCFAHPRPVIARRKFGLDLERLDERMREDGASAIVIGLPLNMDGTMSPRGQASRAFANNVGARRDWPILMWDERLSTVAAERALLEMDVSRAKRAGRIDSAAASFILQGVLDRLAASGGG